MVTGTKSGTRPSPRGHVVGSRRVGDFVYVTVAVWNAGVSQVPHTDEEVTIERIPSTNHADESHDTQGCL
jgi:hypothetical protein